MLWWLALATTVVCQPQAEPQEVEIIKQINRVNEDGSYTFGYEAADGSFKIETRDVMGNVKGMFGFVDETGELKKVSYTANNGTGFKATGERLAPFTTERPSEEEITRRPILVLRQPNDPTRPPVIQHIPRRVGYTTTVVPSTSTTPSYGEYVKGRRTHIVLPTRTKEETTTATPKVTEEPEDEPTQIPLRKLLITRKPAIQGKGGNNLRRQLGGEPDAPSGDVADVYSGGAANPRYIPVQSVRSPQSPLLANLPPHVASAIRQQQIARAAATLRPYTPEDPYSTTSPIPSRPGVIDEQEYPPIPIRPRPLPPVKSVYRSGDEDLPTRVPFPMSSLVSLRDELMDYILRYLQFRLAGGNPYLMNPYPQPYPNPNIPYPTPNYPGVNPNVFNPYYNYPNTPYPRGIPYQPPFNPVGYPPVGYPGVGYPGSFPQPLPFSSPNKQQAGQGYGPSQRSAPSYEQISTPRQFSRNYDQSQVTRGGSATYEQAETRGTSEQSSYTLPPSDVLRMMLARGLSTSTTTAAPVRNVQILGAASSLSSSTLPPPEEMEMQA
ncbi:cyclin-K-like [Macrosteles quadrilineatus]|uniref:cyclin-K-like n=1 Tax=Macrosteles quadrilineatus TaxID=74068 RepID=UPI0023E264E7|nr:cyclin-K-like [Macrosteles quadrilineatus]